MRLFSKLGLTLFATSSLVLTGCQDFFVQKPANISQQVEAENQLTCKAKLACALHSSLAVPFLLG